jgi:hypothetical protein
MFSWLCERLFAREATLTGQRCRSSKQAELANVDKQKEWRAKRQQLNMKLKKTMESNVYISFRDRLENHDPPPRQHFDSQFKFKGANENIKTREMVATTAPLTFYHFSVFLMIVKPASLPAS